MFADADIASVAALLSDPVRVAMLHALSDGREVASSELARVAGVTRSTASIHLAKLAGAGFVAVRAEGRHRHYRLTRAELVRALEALAVVAPPALPRTHRQARIGRAVRAARTCYDHLAGRLGCGLADVLVARGALCLLPPAPLGSARFEVTGSGTHLLSDFGIDLDAAHARRRAFAPACLDWSERVPHVAGALGGALLERLLDLGWIERSPASRAVSVTLAGRRGLARTFGLNAASLMS